MHSQIFESSGICMSLKEKAKQLKEICSYLVTHCLGYCEDYLVLIKENEKVLDTKMIRFYLI